MSGLEQPIDGRHGRGVRIGAWLHYDDAHRPLTKRQLQRALGIRNPRRQYPVQTRVRGESLVLRCDAHYSPHENQQRGAVRAYLERADARAEGQRDIWIEGRLQPENVLQNAPLEQWLDRWSIWLNPSEHDVNPWTAIHVLSQELERRFGIDEKDVFVVQHHDRGGPWHLHVVVPHLPGMRSSERVDGKGGLDDRKTMRAIADKVVRELVLERAVERALDPARQASPEGTSGSGWDQPPTDKQMAVMRAAGRVGEGLTRGEASLVIQEITKEPSWYERGR